MTKDEFLSKFCKDDKICPVITLVFYFGEKEWDASLDLYGMFDIEGILPLIICYENLTKEYGIGDNKVIALDHVSFTVDEGEVVTILGPSGSGKLTLLHLLGDVDRKS